MLSLTALYFLEKQTRFLKRTPDELKDNIYKANFKDFLSKSNKYDLDLKTDFNEFVLKIINGLQYILDVKKEAKKQSGEEWMLNDTNNWLKKDGTYKEILEKVILKLR